MTRDTLLLVGREATDGRATYEAHGERLARRAGVDEVTVATYAEEPIRELREPFSEVSGDRVYAVPMCAAHDHHTIDDVPAALSYVDGDVRYCEPPGSSPVVTELLVDRGSALVDDPTEASLILVAFGSSSTPYHRQAVEYHAARIRDRAAFGQVLPCYLLQNPAVECVRYNVTEPEAVAVPLFLPRSVATEDRVPTELELDRGGIAYADPLGTDPRITDAIYSEFVKQRAIERNPTRGPATFEASLAAGSRPLATDGEGAPY
jgi:sirohydrochlorin ferrochelatase